MQPNTKVLRTKTGVRVLCVFIYLGGMVLFWFHQPFGIPERFKLWVVGSYALLGAVWLADVFFSRIELSDAGLRIVSIPTAEAHLIPRAEIDHVTWAKGCGAILILTSGRKVRLPSVGYSAPGLANTIRAWLKRTAV